MKDEIVQFLFALMAIAVAAAAEELAPAFGGVGLPLLLSVVLVMTPWFKVLPGVMLALGAGAFEDALSGLPPVVSICFFVIAALLARKRYLPRPLLVVIFPVYALWAGLCASGQIGDLFVRVLVSLPHGILALVITFLMLEWLGGKAGFDE